jgi:hypothetical protein
LPVPAAAHVDVRDLSDQHRQSLGRLGRRGLALPVAGQFIRMG